VAGVYAVLFSLVAVLGVILNRILSGYSPEFILEIPPYRFPPLRMLGKKLYFRIKGFLTEAMPVVLLGVLVINILLYLKLLDFISGIFAPVIHGLFGLPKEAIFALVIGFLRKDVAVGMLMTLGLSAKQLFIAATLLAASFPCIATFVVFWKELGFRYLIKATLIMTAVAVIVGTALNVISR
jgi:ferrous iron transport protein B